MSDSTIFAGADTGAIKTSTTPAVAQDSIITSPSMQLARNNDIGSYSLNDVQLFDAQQKDSKPDQPESKPEGSTYTAPYQDLLFRYVEDPLDKGIGMMSFQFDGITEKMAKLLGKPDIASNHAFTLQNLKDTLLNKELTTVFSPEQVKSLELMASNAGELIDKNKLPPQSSFSMFRKPDPANLVISRDSVNKVAREKGHLIDV